MRAVLLLLFVLCLAASAGTSLADTTPLGPAVFLRNPAPNAIPPGEEYSTRYFGSSVAAIGHLVAVGSASDDTAGNDAGTVILFDAATGAVRHTLLPGPGDGSIFGYSVAMNADFTVIGAPGREAGGIGAGDVYQFSNSTGKLERTVSRPSSASGFGLGVAVSDNLLAVRQVVSGSGAGAVSVFDVRTGDYLRTIQGVGSASLAVSGDKIAVGGDEVVSLFNGRTGTLLHFIPNPTPAPKDQFGGSIALSDDRLVVGDWGDDTWAGDAGAAYVFDVNSGDLVYTLQNRTPQLYDYFGSTVTISGNLIAVGQRASPPSAPGAVYLFDAATGALSWAFTPSNACPTPVPPEVKPPAFEGPVAASGDLIVVGARWAAYLFRRPPPAEITLRAVAVGAGCGPTLSPAYGFAEFWHNGQRLYQTFGGAGGGRGFNVAVLDPLSGELRSVRHFDTWHPSGRGDAVSLRALSTYLKGLPKGVLVMIAVADEAGLTSRGNPCTLLTSSEHGATLAELERLGSRKIRDYCYNGSWVMAVFINQDGMIRVLGEDVSKQREACIRVSLPVP